MFFILVEALVGNWDMLLRSQAKLYKVIDCEPLSEEVKSLLRTKGVVFEGDQPVVEAEAPVEFVPVLLSDLLPDYQRYTILDFIQPALNTPWGNLLEEENFNNLKSALYTGTPGLYYQVYLHLQLENREPGWDRTFCLELWRKLMSNSVDI